jgi:phenylpropionate dioxygenase-like ring-hydroxylating dioxygenase large terminal subunit
LGAAKEADMDRELRREPHPYSGAVYAEQPDGSIRVEDKERGKSGRFNLDGSWIEGELTSADPHMLQYIGGPTLPPGRDIFWMFLPPSGGEPQAAMTAPPARGGGTDAGQRPKIIGKYTPDLGKDTDEGKRSVSFLELDRLLSYERHPELLPEVYKKTSTLPGGPKKVNTARYHSKAYHDLEVERLWSKVWQLACREEDIPQVGDYIIYTIVNRSYLIVRTAENEIKAHVNACMHRGRSLRECNGRATDFRCPYHGWRWGIDGSLKDIPSEWDFPGVRDDAQKLGGAKVGTWGGFVFINPDPDCITLEDYMGPEMIAHYAKIKLENRYRQAWVGRVIKANWKVVQEGFLEAYHSIATHPQLLVSGGDLTDSRYDVFGNWGRLGHAMPSASSPTRGMIASEEAVKAAWHGAADMMRGYLKSIIGDEADQFSDMELNESTYSNLFPNFSPWSGWGRIVYRFRPNGDNPDECLMEAMLLAPWPEGKPKPAPAALNMLEPDQSWTDALELGALGRIFDQDCRNFPNVHNGLKSKQPPHIWYSAYQESIIRNFHDLYEKALGLADGE